MTLKELFSKQFNIDITSKFVKQFHAHTLAYETLPTNAQVLGSPLLGIQKMYFLPQTEQELFTLAGIDYRDFRAAIAQSPSINPNFKVTSAPYNLVTSWVLFLTLTSKSITTREKDMLSMDLLKMVHYRFFTSAVGHNLPHGSNEGTMQYTIDNLSNKYSIKSAGSWKNLIAQRCEAVLVPRSVHSNALYKYSPDDAVIDFISGIQTGMRKQIVGVCQEYYNNKDAGKGIDALGMMDDINGDTSLRAITASLDTMSTRVTNNVTNLAEFIDQEYVDIVVKLTNDITTDMFVRFLTKFSEMADVQRQRGEEQLVKGTSGKPLYVGYSVLIKTLLLKTYGICMRDKDVDMKSKVSIIRKVINIYKSSRTSNNDVVAIKQSVKRIVLHYSNSKRESTNSSMRIAFIIYIMLLSFKSMQ